MAETKLHFLHVSKTGGSAVKAALSKAGRTDLRLHSHKVHLADIPRGEGVIFFVRDPIARFVSGFYSRQRQGLPRYDVPWKRRERIAYGRFQTPDALAAALSSPDRDEQQAAYAAMGAIMHAKWSYDKWFGSGDAFAERLDDIVFIGLQEELDADFERLKRRIGLPYDIRLPTDDVAAHRNPGALDRSLSPVARENLQAWYAGDVAFYGLCKALRGRILSS